MILNCFFFLIKAQSNVCTPGFCTINGTCEIINNSPVCICKPGFVGSKCQFDDPCTSNRRPCGTNGACFPIIQTQNVGTSEIVSYHCQCYSGFSGQNCEYGDPSLYLKIF